MKNYFERFWSDKKFRHKVFQWMGRGNFIHLIHAYFDNQMIRVVNWLGVSKVACSVCGWEGAKFQSVAIYDYYRSSAKCPNCGSLERHRALFRKLRERNLISSTLTYLDIAPGLVSTKFLKSMVEYTSIDYGALTADVKGDVQYLPFSRKTYDVVLCFHVLEYVQDWRKALQEFNRILKPEGTLIISENFMVGQEHVIDFDANTLTGSHPLRRFGEDFPKALENFGFEVERWDYLEFNDERGDYIFLCSVPKNE